MPLSSEQEYELRDRELRDAREYKLAELELRKNENKRSPLWSPTVAVAAIAAVVAAAGHWVVSQKNKADMTLAQLEFDNKRKLAERDFDHKKAIAGDEFCYKVLGEAMTRNRGQGAEMIANEVHAVASLVDLGRHCKGDLLEFADRMRSQNKIVRTIPPDSRTSDSTKANTKPTTPINAATTKPIDKPILKPIKKPKPSCTEIKSIRELGWTSGHKTNFCLRLGYDGVHNPFNNYSAGGFCFKGESAGCIAEIERR